MPRVLISLKDAAESGIAGPLGLDLLDFKDPSRGPMGGLTPNELRTALDSLGSNQLVSAACGELLELIQNPLEFNPRVNFFKVGLSGASLVGQSFWLDALKQTAHSLKKISSTSLLVPVFYADKDKADSPDLRAGFQLVLNHGFNLILLDTWDKNSSKLPDCISVKELLTLQHLVRGCGGQFALAGSLDLKSCVSLARAGIKPDWFGFRGAVCTGGVRGGDFEPRKAMELTAGLRSLQG